MEGKKKKIIIITIIVVLLVGIIAASTFSLTGGNKNKGSAAVFQGKSVFYMYDKSNSDIYTLNENSDLYLKEKDKEKEKIASNVSDFLVAGTSVVFSDNENSFFMKKVGKDKIKLASNVENFRFNSGLNDVAYVSEGALYLKNIEKH